MLAKRYTCTKYMGVCTPTGAAVSPQKSNKSDVGLAIVGGIWALFMSTVTVLVFVHVSCAYLLEPLSSLAVFACHTASLLAGVCRE